MSVPLTELRAQRELIQAHLDWIDTQIASAEGCARQYPASPDQPSALPSDATLLAELAEAPTVATALRHASHYPTTPPASAFKIDQEQQLATGRSDVRRAQIGCCLFFVGGILLFLFCLFGLPHLID